MITLWTFLFVFIHAISLVGRLFRSSDLAVLTSLPVPTEFIFRWQLQKFLRGSLWSLGDVLVGFGTLASVLNFPGMKWCAVIPLAVLTWILTLSLAALCAAHVRQSRYAWVYMAVWGGLLGLLIFHWLVNWSLLLSMFDRAAPGINILLPTGWGISLFQLLMPHSNWPVALLLMPVAGVICTLRHSLLRLRSFYAFRETTRQESGDLEPDIEETASQNSVISQQNADERPRQLGPTAILEIIQTRRFLDAPQWPNRNRLESFLWRWFTPRERALSEIAFPNGPGILALWKRIFRDFAVLAVSGLAVGMANPTAKMWFIGCGIFYTGIMVLGCVNNSGRMFRGLMCSGVRIPMYTNFAAGLIESARMLLKVTALQIPMLLSWSILSGALIAHLAQIPLEGGMLLGARGGCLLCATRFIFLVFGFSSGSSDTGRLGFRNVLLLVCIVPLALLFVALGTMGLTLPKPMHAWGATALGVLDAYVLFRLYAWFYNRSFFDLMNVPNRR